MGKKTKSISLAYIKTEYHRLEELQEFQGSLKELSKDNAEKLWRQMVETGFSDPFKVWEDPDGKLNLLDGHQRRRILLAKKSDGTEIVIPDKFPCDYIQCRDKHEAKIRVLQFISQYGKVTDEGLYEFMVENELDPDLLKLDFDLPNLNTDQFIEGYFGDVDLENSGDDSRDKDPGGQQMVICPKCGLKFNAKQ